MRWNAALGVLVAAVAGASVLLLLAFIPAGERSEPFTPGRAFVEHTPAPAWWASHSYDAQVVSGVPPAWRLAHTPTPTPTPTPVPTATPEPTSTSVPYVPPEPTQAPAPPARAPSGDIAALICSYPWPCDEALYVFGRESGLNPNAVNPSSGACGLAQLYPCPPGGLDPVTNLNYAWLKYVDGGYSFGPHWYNHW